MFGGVSRLNTGSQRYLTRMSAAAEEVCPGEHLISSVFDLLGTQRRRASAAALEMNKEKGPLAGLQLMLQRHAEFANSPAPLHRYQPIEVGAFLGKISSLGCPCQEHWVEKVLVSREAVNPSSPQRS